MSHFWRMLLGCMIPILMVFVLPLFGVSEGVTLAVFLVLMLGCHLLMVPNDHSAHVDHHHKHESNDHANS
ncbi:hypothetical protein TBK1r_42720 [Stieleria magnilauensis]|uniref:DUF2933 domain-containing protein n=1 Tax=Stieleria magnilauensis TaxID=2527963 RepID=A0ABX5XTE5_9BACT|nr:hypothetical protein TBK1r_42720 [Planctomycetes bacterium TBK1r]